MSGPADDQLVRAALARERGVRHVVGLQGYQAAGARFVQEMIENGDIGQPLTVSVVSARGPACRCPAASARYPAVPDFATAVRYHRLLEKIQRASDTGTRQDAVG